MPQQPTEQVTVTHDPDDIRPRVTAVLNTAARDMPMPGEPGWDGSHRRHLNREAQRKAGGAR